MSDTASDQEEPLEFKCRKCPGLTFTPAEKDAHRAYHREQKEKARNKAKPGPKSKTRASRTRDVSPEPSELTLFEPASPSPSPPPRPAAKGKKRKNAREEPEAGPSTKRQSKKNYDESIIGSWARGTGA